MAGKWRHKMDLKFSIFIFVHLFCSDERKPLTNIKPKKLSKYLISIKRYNCYNVNICCKKKNLWKFHCIISSDWIKISKNFFSVSTLFEDRLSATDVKSLTIYIWNFTLSLWRHFPAKITSNKKYKAIETFTIKISFLLF